MHSDTTHRPVKLPGEDSAERMKSLEPGRSEQLTITSPSKKRSANENRDTNPRKTRRVCLNFKQLADPFSDKEENEDTSMIAVQIMLDDGSYLAAISDAPNTLKEAKNSDDWTEWENGIREELEQLQAMGTCEVVDKPRDMIPITNKWLFIKKSDSMGLIIQYKARFVVKECSQRPSFDFNETYSPVVCLETIRTLLAMVPDKDLWLSQMDVKGAYLNG